MKLSEIFNALASGELANLHLADNAHSIFDDKKEIVLRSINLGLTDLYHRFYLKRKYELIGTDSTIKAYTVSDDECIELDKLHLNDTELMVNVDYLCLDTKTVQLKDYPKDNQTLTFEYKARHKTLTQQDIDDDTAVELPSVYLNALLAFIASRLYTSIVNQLDGDLNESMRYAQRYMQEIQLLEQQGVDVDNLNQHDWFNQRGFV